MRRDRAGCDIGVGGLVLSGKCVSGRFFRTGHRATELTAATRGPFWGFVLFGAVIIPALALRAFFCGEGGE